MNFEAIVKEILDKRIKDLEELTKVQCSDGNWNYDPYMHGMANGMILSLHTVKGEEGIPEYKEAPVKWLADKISNEILNTRILTAKQLLARLKFLKKALTALDLISETSKRSIKYEPGCTASLSRATPKIGRWLFSVKCKERWSKGPYDVRFRILKGQTTKDTMAREIEVSCTCNAWRYNGADYNALKKDYSERQYSNGEPPTERDPKRKYLICKHVAACIPLFSGYIVPKEMRIKKKKK